MLLLEATERRSRICERLASCFHDYRYPSRVEHSVLDLVRQRLMGLALDLDATDALLLGALPLTVQRVRGYREASQVSRDLQAQFERILQAVMHWVYVSRKPLGDASPLRIAAELGAEELNFETAPQARILDIDPHLTLWATWTCRLPSGELARSQACRIELCKPK